MQAARATASMADEGTGDANIVQATGVRHSASEQERRTTERHIAAQRPLPLVSLPHEQSNLSTAVLSERYQKQLCVVVVPVVRLRANQFEACTRAPVYSCSSMAICDFCRQQTIIVAKSGMHALSRGIIQIINGQLQVHVPS